jgi:hypothetical protein
MQTFLRWGLGIVFLGLLYGAGGFGAPIHFYPWTALTGCLLVYAWKANRPDTFALIFVAYLMFFSLDSGFLSHDAGEIHLRWSALWGHFRPRVGWLVLGGTATSLVLRLINFPVVFLPRPSQSGLRRGSRDPSPGGRTPGRTMAAASVERSRGFQTTVAIRHLDLSFVVTQQPIEVFAPAELKQELAKWRGRTVFIDYQVNVDGPQTAARLINEVFSSVGITVRGSDTDAEAFVWIQDAEASGRFAYAVVSPLSTQNRIANICGPTELTAAVMRAVGLFFSRYGSETYPGTPLRISSAAPPAEEDHARKVDSLLAEIDLRQSASAETEIVRMGETAVDNLVDSAVQVNRLICAALLSGDADQLHGLFGQFAGRVRILGATRSPRAVKTLLDALADSTQTASSGLTGACVVKNAAADALVSIGAGAMPELRKHLNHPKPAIREAIRTVVRRIESD